MHGKLPFAADILDIHKFSLALDSGVVHERTSSDYELDFYMSGPRTMEINGNRFLIENGSLVFRRPGDHTRSSGAYNCYAMTLDFSHEKFEGGGKYHRNDPKNPIQRISDEPLLSLLPSHFVVRDPSEYVKIYDKLCYNFQNVNSGKENEALLSELFFLALSNVCHNLQSDAEGSRESRVLNESCRYIQENFHRTITIKELADNVSFSPSYFFKLFKRAANTTPAEYIISVRMSNAKRLLLETELTMAEIAEACGFNDASYFSCCFKKLFGATPSEYRQGEQKK